MTTLSSVLTRLDTALSDLERFDRTKGLPDDPKFWAFIRYSHKRLEWMLLGQLPLEAEDIEHTD